MPPFNFKLCKEIIGGLKKAHKSLLSFFLP